MHSTPMSISYMPDEDIYIRQSESVFKQRTHATAGAEELSNGVAETCTWMSPIFEARAKRLWGKTGLFAAESLQSEEPGNKDEE